MSRNLIVNGDFSAGNTGFTSEYNYVDPNPAYRTHAGDYSVVQNPGAQFSNGYDSYGDHDAGHDGEMLFVDGNTHQTAFWEETVPIKANQTYNLVYYVTGSDETNLPAVVASLNGDQIGAYHVVQEYGGGKMWEKVLYTFSTSLSGNLELVLSDHQTTRDGNAFTIDDISLHVAKGFGQSEPAVSTLDHTLHLGNPSLDHLATHAAIA